MRRSQAPSSIAKARKASALVSKASARATTITLKRELVSEFPSSLYLNVVHP